MSHYISLILLLFPLCTQTHADSRFKLETRASIIFPQAKEYPEINFVFQDEKGKPKDVQHAIVDTSYPSRGQLVIWLMGHNNELFERLASYGYHAIQPHYANGWFGSLSDQQLKDGTSIGQMRLEAATGEDVSAIMNLNKTDSLKARSLQFLLWLAKNNPEGHWAQFITTDGNDLIWENVVLAGISHGATTAARFAKHQKVARVVMLSGPRDQHETWQAFPSATPANRMFGFTHILDGGWSEDHYCRSWQMLGLADYGEIVNVEEHKPPYKNSRRLITAADVQSKPNKAHTCVQPGGTSIKDKNGNYTFEEVWRYLFTHPVEQIGEPAAPDPDCLMNHSSQ